MPRRHLSPFGRRARQLLGRPVYYRVADRQNAGDGRVPPTPPRRSLLGVAYTGVRRPCICTGCICLTPAERVRQQRVFKLVRAVTRAYDLRRSS